MTTPADDALWDNNKADDSADQQLVTICQDVAADLLVRARKTTGTGQRRLPDPQHISEALTLYRRLLFPEVWTENGPPDTGQLRRMAERLHRLMMDLLYAEKMAQPNRAGQAPLDANSDDARDKVRGWAHDRAQQIVAGLPTIRRAMDADLEAFVRGDPAARSQAEIILCYPGFRAIATYRLGHIMWEAGGQLVARMMTERAKSQTGIDLHPGAEIGTGFFIDHGTGVVVGETSVIGEGVRIYQGVTLGARSIPKVADRPTGKRHPTLERGVVVYANATILGGDTVIGEGAIIGGNAWVTMSVPAGARMRVDVAPRVAETVIAIAKGAQPE